MVSFGVFKKKNFLGVRGHISCIRNYMVNRNPFISCSLAPATETGAMDWLWFLQHNSFAWFDRVSSTVERQSVSKREVPVRVINPGLWFLCRHQNAAFGLACLLEGQSLSEETMSINHKFWKGSKCWAERPSFTNTSRIIEDVTLLDLSDVCLLLPRVRVSGGN